MTGTGPNVTGRIVAQNDFQAMRQIEKTRAGAIIMINNLSNSINKTDIIIPVNSTKHFPKTGAIKIGFRNNYLYWKDEQIHLLVLQEELRAPLQVRMRMLR